MMKRLQKLGPYYEIHESKGRCDNGEKIKDS
jgi:hypothetical protein